MIPSKRQLEVIRLPNTRLVICPGPVRCGKTTAAVWGLAKYIGMNFEDVDVGLAARSDKQFRSVVLRELRRWAAMVRLPIRKVGHHYEIPSMVGRTPNRWYPLLGSDVSSAGRIQGMTLAGALLDEFILMPREFVDEIMLRCSEDDARIVMTCNPSGPLHWGKLDFVDRADDIDATVIPFQLSDNPSLSQSYIDSLHAQFSGAVYQRKVLGEWAASTGLVYPNVSNAIRKQPPVKECWRWEVTIDVASSSVTHALLIGRFPTGSWVVDEWRWDGAQDGQLTDQQQVDRIAKRWSQYSIPLWTVDPAANAFALSLMKRVQGRVVHGRSGVLEGIQLTAHWLNTRKMNIDPRCQGLIRELGSYSWDELASSKGEDRPVKGDDHGADALRYYCYTRAIAEARGKSRHVLVT